MSTKLSPGEIGLLTALLRERPDSRSIDRAIDRVRAHLSPEARRVAEVLFKDADADQEALSEAAFIRAQAELEPVQPV